MSNPQVIILPVEQIQIGTRQRSNDAATLKHIKELSDEIASNGLLHAVAVNKSHELVAGYCRLNAVKLLKTEYHYASAMVDHHFIPCVVIHQESERDQFRVELMENLRRKALSPLDEALAIASLHKMFQDDKGAAWSQEQTGKELDTLRGEDRHPRVGHKEVSDAILLSGFADDPDVQKAASRGEAVKIATKKLEQAFTQGLGALATKVVGDYQLVEANLLDYLPGYESNSFHGIIADPPYGIGADNFGDQTMIGGHAYEDTLKLATEIAGVIFEQGFRICRENAHLYMFCDLRYFDGLSVIAQECGWRTFATPLIWHKINVGHAPWPGFFSHRYECVLFAMKGNRKLQRSRSDVFEYSVTGDKLHAAQKPVDLYKEFMGLSFFHGELVLDPCAGSGTIFKAAKEAGLRAVGIENNPESANLCRQVISEL